MAKYKTFTVEQLEEAQDDYTGFCIVCGAEHHGVEDDAEKYECEVGCGNTVYGAGQIAIIGLIKDG